MFVMDGPYIIAVHFTDGSVTNFGVKSAQAIEPCYLKMLYANGNQGILNMNQVQWVSAYKERTEDD